jgi:serine/threonine protein kinase
VWKHLQHPNILPLLGVDLGEHRLAMISEWMDLGNINEFVKKYDGVNRVQLVSHRAVSGRDRCDRSIQLVDAATGLEYMHSSNVVHGDLKGVRLIVSISGCATTHS